MIDVLLVFFLLACIGTLAVCSGAETAYFSLSSMQVKAFRKDSDSKKRQVAKLLSTPRDLLVTLIILIIFVSLSIQNIISTLFGEQNNWFLSVGVPIIVNLLLGEMIPKSLAIPHNAKIALALAPLLAKVQHILLPLRKFLSKTASFVTPWLFCFLRKEEEISLDELHHALKDSKERGVLLLEEAELIRGYLRLQEAFVKDLMRPREEILFLDLSEPLSRLIHLFVDMECTRILLCQGGLDHLIGIISSRIFFLNRHEIHETQDLISLVKKPFFIPETLRANLLLKQLYEKKESLAVVVSEYGSIAGVIAMEDLIEEVIGEISDRRDREVFFTRSGENVIIASGKLELFQFEEIFGKTLKTHNHLVTLGGWLTEQLGDIPKPGYKFSIDGFFFHVLSADPTRVRRIYVRQLEKGKV